MKIQSQAESDLKRSRELALHYMETLVEVARESFKRLQENITRMESYLKKGLERIKR